MRHKASVLSLAPAQKERRCTLNKTMPLWAAALDYEVERRGCIAGPSDGYTHTGGGTSRP
jgi:hypothetical protein